MVWYNRLYAFNSEVIDMVYVCPKCYSQNTIAKKNGNQIGIYCAECGRWIKWANKDEAHLLDLEEPKQTEVELTFAKAHELLKDKDCFGAIEIYNEEERQAFTKALEALKICSQIKELVK